MLLGLVCITVSLCAAPAFRHWQRVGSNGTLVVPRNADYVFATKRWPFCDSAPQMCAVAASLRQSSFSSWKRR